MKHVLTIYKGFCRLRSVNLHDRQTHSAKLPVPSLATCSSTKRKPEEVHTDAPKKKKPVVIKEEPNTGSKKVAGPVEKPQLLPPPPPPVGKVDLPGPSGPEVKQSQDQQRRIVEQQQIINEQHRQLLVFRDQQMQMQRAFDQELMNLRNIIEQQGQQLLHLKQARLITAHSSDSSFSSASSDGTPRPRPVLPPYSQISQSLVSPAVSDVISPYPQTPSLRQKAFFPSSRSPLIKHDPFQLPIRSMSYPEGVVTSDFPGENPSFPLASMHVASPAISQPQQQQPSFHARGEEGGEEEGPGHIDSRMVSPPKEFELLAHEAFGPYEGFSLPPLEMEKTPPFISVSVSSGSGAGYGVGQNEVTQEATVSSRWVHSPST